MARSVQVRWATANCLVEQSHQPVKKTLEQIGVSRPTFCRWYDLYRRFGEAALEDQCGGTCRVCYRIPNEGRDQVLQMALDQPELPRRELAVTFTDERRYFVSEASVYRLLKAHDLIASPGFIVMKAADEFKQKTTAPNQLWQTDFAYLKSEPLGRHVFETHGEWMGLVLSVHRA